MTDTFILDTHTISSRLFLGTGKFSSPELMKAAIEASESKLITAAVRRVNLDDPNDTFIQVIDPKSYIFVPNTSGARTADEAVRIARLAKAAGHSNWVKVEVTPEPHYLLPDAAETLKATDILTGEGFHVLPYIHADPILAKQLESAGAAAVMPLAAPIGSNLGLEAKAFIQIIIEQSTVPVIVDAGIGAPSHACEAMELGADAVLVNTAIATARDPVAMAIAFKNATIAGRQAYLAGLPSQQLKAEASSPLTGFLQS